MHVLTEEETSMLHILNWMEQSYKDTVFVLDINFETGGVCLYGEPSVTQKFRGEFETIMADVYAKVPVWREF
jgi:hypothetical protein